MDPSLLIGPGNAGDQVAYAAALASFVTVLVSHFKPSLEAGPVPVANKNHDLVFTSLPYVLCILGAAGYRLYAGPITLSTVLGAIGEGLVLGLGSNAGYQKVRGSSPITPLAMQKALPITLASGNANSPRFVAVGTQGVTSGVLPEDVKGTTPS